MRFFPSARRQAAADPTPADATPVDSAPVDAARRGATRRGAVRLPGWLHPQWAVVYLAALLAVAGLAIPVARADDTDDLKQRQQRVEGRIDRASQHLEESSRQVARVTGRLQSAQADLGSARQRLTRVRSDLVDARALRAKLATRLEKAQDRFEVAVADVKQARLDVAVQRDETRDTVIGMATAGDPGLAMISSYLDSGSVEEIMVAETGNGVVVAHEHRVLDDLVAAEEAFEERRDEVRDARNAVAESKQAAEDNLERMKTLMTQAKDTRDRIVVLVGKARNARQAAVRAKARDEKALRELEAREASIKQQILAASRKQGGSYSGATDGLLHVPTSGPVTSPYGYRTHPIYGYYGLHNGTDFGAACGSQLWAGATGTVVNTYYDEVYGNRLYLAIGRVNGAVITLVYNHLSRYAVSQGQTVGRGDVVGYVGSTGWSTGCHLHFTVLRNGTPVDPMGYL